MMVGRNTKLFGLLIIAIAIGTISYYKGFDSEKTIVTVSLSVATFLFGIFIGFSISDRHARIEKVRANDSSERSEMVSVYKSALIFGKNIQKKIQQRLDQYLMLTLDYRIWDFYKTEKEFEAFAKEVLSIKAPVNNSKKAVAYYEMSKRVNNMRDLRGETAEIINERLSPSEWIILGFLGLAILSSLVLIGNKTISSFLLVTGLSGAVIFLTYFLYSLDSLSWKKEARIFEPYEQTFESIGLMRYYPKDLIREGRVRKHKGKSYRMGIFPKPYPDLSGKKIEIVRAASTGG